LPIRLEIYIDKSNKATGLLYLDDGETHNYRDKEERTLINFSYENNILTKKAVLRNSFYDMAAEMKIQEVSIYGV
jgi:hypothetical protein